MINAFAAMAGPDVTTLEPGDVVGLGWHSDYCMTCSNCMSGDHNLCLSVQPTIVGRHGGFADKVAVIGIGGLGHLALKFLNAWDCEVTAFASSATKKQEALDMGVIALLRGQKSVSASPVGSPGTIARMLDFAAFHGIKPDVEEYNISRINEAVKRLRSGAARYRVVIAMNSAAQ